MDNIPNEYYFPSSSASRTSSTSMSTGYDAFGRLRVSNPITLFDSQNRYKINDKFYSNVLNGGSITYSSTDSVVNMNVTTTLNSFAGSESKYVFSYQPGKSLLCMSTFVMNSSKNGLIQRVGYFGTDNGYFVELSGTVLSVVERSKGNDTPVTQPNWNIDKLDGTGPSKAKLDITKAQIFFVDIEWLGVGSVRIGFVIDGRFVICHIFHHANMITSTYMTTACLPVRYEIKNTDSSSGTLKKICSTVISEGGYNPKSQLFCVSGPVAGTVFTNTLIPVCTIRLDPGRLDSIVHLKQVNVAVNTNNDLVQWRLVLNGTLTGATFAASTGGSTNVQVDTAASAISGGKDIEIGFSQTGSIESPLSNDFFEAQLGRNSFTGTTETLTLCIVGLSQNPKAFWSIGWLEVL